MPKLCRVLTQFLVALLLSSCVQADLLRLVSVPIVFSRPDNNTTGTGPSAAHHDAKDSSIIQIGGFVGAEVNPQQRATTSTTRPCSQSTKFTLQVSQLVGTIATPTDTAAQSTVFGTRTTAQTKSIETITVTVARTVTGTAASKPPCTRGAKHSTSTALTFATGRTSSPTSTITVEVGTASPTSLLASNPSTTDNIVLVTVTSMLRTTSTLLSGAATTYISKTSSTLTTSTIRATSLAMGSNSTAVFTLASQTMSALPAMQTTSSANGRLMWTDWLAIVPLILIAGLFLGFDQ